MARKLPPYLRKNWLPAAALAVFSAVLLGNRGFRRLIANTLQLRRLHGEIEALKEEQVVLEERVAAARHDDHAIERAARRELGYLKQGEIEYRFPPPGKKK